VNEPFEFTGDDGARLVGTLVRPAAGDSVPGALLLNGSGPLDRDSNMPGQPLNIANAFASALASHGVASVRYDKRGVGESSGDYLTTGFEQEMDDAKSALDALRVTQGIDPSRVTAIGHSIGATIAIRLASRQDWLAGVVLLSGATRSGEEVMRWQSERIAASRRGLGRLRARRFLRDQERLRRLLVASIDDVASIDGSQLPARWFREFMEYEPALDLPTIRCPILAITGRSDIQVDPDDVERMRELVSAPFVGETPESLTHILRRDRGRPSLGAYRKQFSRPVDLDLVERIASWTSAR
jgi:uncharacterized protein